MLVLPKNQYTRWNVFKGDRDFFKEYFRIGGNFRDGTRTTSGTRKAHRWYAKKISPITKQKIGI